MPIEIIKFYTAITIKNSQTQNIVTVLVIYCMEINLVGAKAINQNIIMLSKDYLHVISKVLP